MAYYDFFGSLVIAIVVLGHSSPLSCQAPPISAGEDKEICFGQSVSIGATTNPLFCYTWEAHGDESSLDEGDIHNPTPIVNPAVTTTYILTVVGPDFEWKVQDEVVVKLVSPESISATTDNCCWEPGNPITVDQFDITTVPPDLDGEILVSPDVVPETGDPVSNTQVTLEYHCTLESESVETTVPLTIVDDEQDIESLSINNEAGFQFQIGNHTFELSFEDLANKFKKLDILSNGDRTFEASINGSLSRFYDCCEEGSITECSIDHEGGKIEVTGSGSIGFEVALPAYGIAKIASVNVIITLGLDASITVTLKSACITEDELCFDFTASGTVGGGVGLETLGDVIEASLIVEGELQLPSIKYCVPNRIESDGLVCVEGRLKGHVSALSFYTYDVNIPLFPKTCTRF